MILLKYSEERDRYICVKRVLLERGQLWYSFFFLPNVLHLEKHVLNWFWYKILYLFN